MASGSFDNPSFALDEENAFDASAGDCELPASRREDASIAWLNRRWFRECGRDADSVSGYESASAWLLRRFAYELDTATGAATHADAATRARYAVDGYGTTSLARYGGSGRAGVIHGLQVKGIGRTPFAASDADWHHSHGFLWLEEGLREAFFSELCHAQAPCGAVPVVAIIALDERIAGPDGAARQRALLVRPFRTRPAHLQRALLLERSDLNDPIATHLHDAARVQRHVRFLAREPGGAWQRLGLLAGAYGRQAAYSHTHGWFNGGMTSSNLSLNGEFIDFGSARFVADARASVYEFFGLRFGNELSTAAAVLDSVAFYLRKYAGPPASTIDLGAVLASAYRDQLARGVASLLGAHAPTESLDELADRMQSAFALIGPMKDRYSAVAAEEHAFADCARILARDGGANAMPDVDAALSRWRLNRSRTRVSRELVQAQIESWLADTPPRLDAQWPTQLQARIDCLIADRTGAATIRDGRSVSLKQVATDPRQRPHDTAVTETP